MYNFIDLHCHALFGVDDGANDFDTSKRMLQIAYNDGIKTICFTPHFKIHKFEDDNDIEEYNDRLVQNLERLKEYTKEALPDMTLLLGNEIMFHSDISSSISSKKCRTINQGTYALIEFRPNTSKFDIQNSISRLTRKGYKPIIAHIERYTAFANNFSFLREIKELGASLQINAGSITKFKIGKTARLIKKALKHQLVDIISTDAHDDKVIIPCLSKAHKKVEKLYGKDYAKKLFHDNAFSIINND